MRREPPETSHYSEGGRRYTRNDPRYKNGGSKCPIAATLVARLLS